MATPTQIRRRGRFSLILGTLVAGVLFAAVAYADNVKNDVVAGGSDTLTTGGSTTINYWIQATGGTCDAADGSAAVVTITVPSGVSAAPSSLTFTACNTSGNEANPNNTQSVTFSSSTPGDYNITASVADTSGTYNASPAAFTLHVLAPADATPPVITPNIVGTLGADGWYTSDVTVSWSVVDNESAITSTSGCGPTTINADTTGTTLTCSATSAGGTNSQSVTIKRDATNPTISGAVSPPSPDGNNFWYKTAPTVSFTCSDATSGIFSCVADGTSPASDSKTLGESASAQTVSGTATDNAGNSNTASVTGLKVDLSAPVITRNMSADSCSLLGTNDWCRGTQTAGFTATDAISGIAPTEASPVNFTQSTPTNGAAVNIASGTKFDMAGHESNSIDAGPFKIDSVDPAVTCQSPAPAFLLNQPGAQVSASVADGTSGPLNATESGAADTSSVGSKTVTIIGYDNAGNSKTVSCSYSVGYGFDGLFAPVNKPNTLNVSKAGQAVPLKWRLTDYFGDPVTDLGSATVSVTNASCDSGSTTDDVEEYATGSSGLQNLGDGYYQFNWKSPTSYANSCKWLNLKLGAEPTRTMLAYFSFKK